MKNLFMATVKRMDFLGDLFFQQIIYRSLHFPSIYIYYHGFIIVVIFPDFPLPMKLKNTHTHKTNEFFFDRDMDFPLRAFHIWQEECPRHRHEFSECVLILDGGGPHQCEDHAPTMLRRGDILVIPPGGYHAYLKG
ncbi:MAG: cupin domain-containing protein, partial [Victivallales bacterium]|nr:cupin domain-containing protein [Victivallales bacterium]